MHHSREYRKLFKKYKKQIIRQAKRAANNPFDYESGLEIFVKHLYFMRDYYKLGENVWAQEDEDITRLEMLNQILFEYENWDRFNCFAKTKECDKHKRQFFLLLDKYIERIWD